MSKKYELLRSLTTDSVSESEVKVTGQVPEWLEGSLFRYNSKIKNQTFKQIKN